MAELSRRALELKEERRAIILAHLYQRPEIQDIADYVGDSLGLAQSAARTDCPVIIFCGVHFMAETACILSPDKTVILPEPEAGCPMADMVDVEGLIALKRRHPGVPVICYVNSSAAVKAESDICCTSRNAVRIVESFPADTVIFVPDKNLGSYVASRTRKKVILWEGHCPTHLRIAPDDVRRFKREHPRARVMVHPECSPEVIAMADKVASTQGMLVYAESEAAREFIVGTEMGIGHQLRKKNPGKEFYFPSGNAQVCPNMKATTLRKVVTALERLEPRITVPEEIRRRALAAVERMVAVD